MHQFQQMHRNLFMSTEGSHRVDVQAVTDINHFPARQIIVSGPARDLARDQRQSLAPQQRVQMRLDRAYESSVVPMHEVSFLDRVNKIHFQPINQQRQSRRREVRMNEPKVEALLLEWQQRLATEAICELVASGKILDPAEIPAISRALVAGIEVISSVDRTA